MMPNPMYSITTNPKGISPFLNGFGFSVDMHEGIGSLIVGLLLYGSPSAVVRRVVAIIVNPVYRVLSGWAWSHIREKCGKVVFPLITNLDISGEIIFTSGVVRVIASPPNIKPRKIFRRISQAVFRATGRCHLSRKASTGSVVSPPEVFARRYFGISTFADALPVSDAASAWGSTNDRKAVVCISNFVLKCSHNILRQMLSRVVGSGSRHGKRFSVANLATPQLYHVKAT